jgi:hypothetical protein
MGPSSISCTTGDTFLDVLILVEGLDGVILAKTAEGVDQVGAQVRVDVLRTML